MNISKETIKALEELYNVCYFKDMDSVTPEEANELYIAWELPSCDYIGKRINVPKVKEVTLEYVQEKLVSDKVYKDFAAEFKKLLPGRSLNVYPTSYGIGVSAIYNMQRNEIQDMVEGKLAELGIAYTTEYSDAHWVYRYKISKSKESIERIKAMSNGTT